ncbi:multidrug effflux MFS transporter [Acinetobacter baumannii]|uniref:multidrug effflux MFS transporter n=1 Tax=Acinetobacter baumannii TaxID=470 RepID=UPI002341C1FC|nr:multidrug effflux MFS transporter [Acinetobacter baumannii]MDO7443050.1 multidrug effflux MFS transporter [Acinetobacter baumannii]MDV7414011.1 multidrug effflux MFS transporter [Acinetobacter baumannii]
MKSKNYALIGLLGALVAFGPLSIDMYLPSLPQMSVDLASSAQQIQKTITVFLVGFSIGMLFYGPLSDIYGRKKILIIGISIYIFASIGCTLSESVEQLTLFRFLQALGGASASVISRALVKDLFEQNHIPKVLSLMHIITMIATLIAPTLGGLLTQYFGWNAIFKLLSLFSASILLGVFLRIPNEFPKNSRPHFIKNYIAVIKDSRAWSFIFALSGTFAGMFAYITASSFIFVDQIGFSQLQYAFLFGFNITGIIIFTILNTYFLRKYSSYKLLKAFTLVACISGFYLLLISLLNFHHPFYLIIGLLMFVGVTGAIGANAIANLLNIFSQAAGTVSGFAVSFQFGFGALASYFTVLLYRPDSSLAMTLIMAICGFISFLSLRINKQLKNYL